MLVTMRFLYARYMGIETHTNSKDMITSQFLYARYMGIETHKFSVPFREVVGSCTLAIWVLKLSRLDNSDSIFRSCTLAIWVLKPLQCTHSTGLFVLVRSLYGY